MQEIGPWEVVFVLNVSSLQQPIAPPKSDWAGHIVKPNHLYSAVKGV